MHQNTFFRFYFSSNISKIVTYISFALWVFVCVPLPLPFFFFNYSKPICILRSFSGKNDIRIHRLIIECPFHMKLIRRLLLLLFLLFFYVSFFLISLIGSHFFEKSTFFFVCFVLFFSLIQNSRKMNITQNLSDMGKWAWKKDGSLPALLLSEKMLNPREYLKKYYYHFKVA